MGKTSKNIAVAAGAVAVVLGGAGAAAASSAADADTPISGAAASRAEDAALAETGGGEVTGTEVGDEDSYYEVEVTLDDGRQVDVQLDADFAVVATMADRDQTHE